MAEAQDRLDAKSATHPAGPWDYMQTTLTTILGMEMLGTDSAYSVLQRIFMCCVTTPGLYAASSCQI